MMYRNEEGGETAMTMPMYFTAFVWGPVFPFLADNHG